jgi:hypothetical protein
MPQETATRLFILASFHLVTTAPWLLKVAADASFSDLKPMMKNLVKTGIGFDASLRSTDGRSTIRKNYLPHIGVGFDCQGRFSGNRQGPKPAREMNGFIRMLSTAAIFILI